ncbi:uncharacterized protein LOC130962044 [Arachis stenosperma]|uniref:uncharacterized protein LOC130962044 n=1 Tax=Arachis stenosperma TaxID=217475 RepID=UPI0025AD67A0|nr:uncharacterized protein LOC130962044 [Arachis stenosperma]
MDVSTHKFFQSPSVLAPLGEPVPIESNMSSLYGKNKNSNPFVDDDFPDPLCKLNLKETSEFVKSFPVPNANNDETRSTIVDVSAQRREQQQRRVALEAPATPGRPFFSFTTIGRNLSRKSIPSKWDDAEKWLMSSSCHDSPAHVNAVNVNVNVKKVSESESESSKMECFSDKSRVTVTEERDSKAAPNFRRSSSLDHQNMFGAFNGVSCPTDIVLKDKFTESIEPILPSFRYSEPTKEGFLFRNNAGDAMKDACTEMAYHHHHQQQNEIQHRDVGTEMTPLGSSTTSRCHTPIKSSSPQRHNTPESRSGPLAMANTNSTTCNDLIQLEECHFSKLQLGTQYDLVTSNWSSSGEEEEEISKSLRHNGSKKGDPEYRAATWEEEEKTKCCLRYQREEAKIQAWVNLQSAKAEAQSKKLEVKIQKMRSNLEEKLMKRMSVVHRKAEEWRESARQQHLEQIQKATEQAQKMIHKHHHHHSTQFSSHTTISCGCFPCHNIHH